jgi:8-oxo-dGTP pyrophosphatase MutT (NUDIX family)
LLPSRSGLLAALRADTEDLLRRYHARFPGETARHPSLVAQIGGAQDLFTRRNMTGHVTASATVLNRTGTKVLLVHHKVLGKWLPPGGHYEAPGSLWDSAIREVAEEAGLVGLEAHPWMRTHGGIPIDIDTHPIPANPHKAEGAHTHHDFCFLAVGDDGRTLSAQLAEVHDARWLPIGELHRSPDARVRALGAKLARLGLSDA